MRRVVFHELAEQDLNEAADYYAGVRRNLGAAFLQAVEVTVQRIAEAPTAGSPHDDLRWWPVRRFPYAIVYRVRDDSIRVLAVAHQRRQPYWRSRV